MTSPYLNTPLRTLAEYAAETGHKTLHMVLAEIGLDSRKVGDNGRREIFHPESDCVVGQFTAFEAWEWIERYFPAEFAAA